MSLNATKTNFLIFHYNNDKPTSFHVNINNKKITRRSEVKYLGIYIDENLNFKYHIDLLCTKVSKTIVIIAKLRHYANLQTIRQVYYALIYPHLLYGIVIWGNNYSSHLSKLQRKQNKIINLMHLSQNIRNFIPLCYKRSNILKLSDICFVQTSMFTYDFKFNNLPSCFQNYLKPRNFGVNIRTRGNEHNYYQEFTRTKYSKFCIKTTSVIAWSKVPDNLKEIFKRSSFKKRLIRHILNNMLVNPN